MPILPLETPDLHYFLISFDARGKELPETDGSVDQRWMSAELADRLRRTTNPVTDIFLVCHGWNTTAGAAHNSYVQWMSAMADDNADVARAGAGGRPFNPLLIGVQWPSKFADIGGAALPADVLATALDGGGGGTAGTPRPRRSTRKRQPWSRALTTMTRRGWRRTPPRRRPSKRSQRRL